MEIIYAIIYAVLIAGAGVFIGCGNHHGLSGAILPGIILGLLAAIHNIREQPWSITALIIVAAIIGTSIAAMLPDNNAFKRFSREQKNLHIKVGKFELGRSPTDHS